MKIRGSIRRFIAVWTAAIVLVVGAILAATIRTSTRHQEMFKRLRLDAAGVEEAIAAEGALLAQRREDLIWHHYGDRASLDRSVEDLAEVSRLVAGFRPTVTSAEEAASVREVEARFAEFRAHAEEDRHRDPSDVRPYTERLLEAMRAYRALNRRQMEATVAEGRALSETSDRWSAILFVVLPFAAIAAGAALWRRIFRPTIGFATVARAFGAGDLAARAPVERDDEMGDVARTFNAMADEIADRERERLDFVAALAHDLRTPLSVIGGTVHLLRKQSGVDAARRADWLDRILDQVRRLEAMTLDLTNAVQIQTGRLVLETAPVDLAALVRKTVEDETQTASGRPIRVDAPDRCPIVGDRRRLERVVDNLLSNAAKYSKAGTEILVTLAARDGSAVLTVADRGIGIAPADLKTLFRPFRRARGAAGAPPGTGLGLFSAKRIVEAHGGSIEIRSEVGAGTTVEVAMPLGGTTAAG